MDRRTTESCSLKRKLGFRLQDMINIKEQTVLESIKDAFEGENMRTQYSVSGYKIEFYFHDCNIAIEVDEFDHCDRDSDDEEEREEELKEEFGCKC